MNRKAAQLGLRDTHFVRPDGLDVAGHVSSARDVTKLARVAMNDPTVRSIVRLRSAEAAGRNLFTWNDLLGRFPGLIGVKTGHTSAAGWSQVAAARGRGLTVYATILGAPTRSSRNADLSQLLAWGLSRYRVVPLVQEGRVYARASLPYGKAPVALVASRPAVKVVRIERPLVERVVAPMSLELPVRKGQRVGVVRVYDGRKLLATRPLVARRSVEAPGRMSKVGWYAKETLTQRGRAVLVIVTVTLNAAIDRTLTVPNVQLGHRHRASQGMTLAGGKGINVARALKRLDVPVIVTGLAGGRTGTRIVEELTAEAILNDFVRIADESRTSTAVVDPTTGTYTEINEWGPHVSEDELAMLVQKLRYLSRGTDAVVFSGSLPRGVDDGFYGEVIRELNRRGVQTVLDSEGMPLRLGAEAEPFLVTPNVVEAEGLVGQEFTEEEDFAMALDAIAEMGPRNVLITRDDGCVALLREERSVRRFHAQAPRLEPISAVGTGDVLLAGFLASRLDGRSPEESLRTAVAAGAAATLEVGAGRFDPRDLGRLIGGVRVEELAAVKA